MIKKKVKKKIKKKTVTNKPITSIKDNPNYKYLDYYDVFTLRQRPVSDLFLEKLAKEMIEWAETPEALTYRQFLRLKGIGNTDFDRFCKRSPALKAAKAYAFSVLADKREIGALNRKYEHNTARIGLYQYDKAWRGIKEWESNLKVQQNEAIGKSFKTVEVPIFPETDIVPKKESSDETRDED